MSLYLKPDSVSLNIICEYETSNMKHQIVRLTKQALAIKNVNKPRQDVIMCSESSQVANCPTFHQSVSDSWCSHLVVAYNNHVDYSKFQFTSGVSYEHYSSKMSF